MGRAWWLGMWPSGQVVHWWLTSRIIDERGPGLIEPPVTGRIPMAAIADTLRELDDAVPGRGGRRAAAAYSAALADPDRERELARTLGRLLLPPALRQALLASGATPDTDETVVIAPGPSLAHLPFDLLAVDDEATVRLIEVARVRGGLPATSTTAAPIRPKDDRRGTLRVIDPGPSAGAAAIRGGVYSAGVPAPVYTTGLDDRWFHRHADHDRLLNETETMTPVTREELSTRLRADPAPARLVFLGHALAGLEHAPAAAGLVLADPADGGPFRPFTAADWIREPARWPAPPQVALVACHSTDTHLHEHLGLVQAAVNAGAVQITATRWVLPADGTAENEVATTDLALAIDAAHGSVDPIGRLRNWQLQQLQQWRHHPRPANAPVTWAAPVTYQLAPLEEPAR